MDGLLYVMGNTTLRVEVSWCNSQRSSIVHFTGQKQIEHDQKTSLIIHWKRDIATPDKKASPLPMSLRMSI